MKYVYLFILLSFAGLMPQGAKAQSTIKGSFSDISFIQGHWTAKTASGQDIEAVWLAPKPDHMVGFMRMMRGDKIDLYEILAYEYTDNRLISMVKHFKPGLIGQEEKDKQDRYAFVEASKDRAVFQKEGGEMRVLYEKRGDKQFAIAIGNPKDGKYSYNDLFLFSKVAK
ncbi:DUF6265 family protein [Pedobacter deserti]|uniref:DUF6265 family protein n=1 Tax=Pedobacter deserti TaxID=2817382 RepID=UPI00210C0DA3|nr:DUF6265 family protein [Pedobacter sp. SYSU D00382]